MALVRILLIGDIVGRPGRQAVRQELATVIDETGADLVVANGENAAGGFGLTAKIAQVILQAGVDLITTGNHVWDRKEFVTEIESLPQVVRPANFPEGAPGRGWAVATSRRHPGLVVAVLNLMGRTFMAPLDCPFRAADRLLPELRAHTPIILVDFHGEATAEKVAMGWYLDGRVSGVFGTHTHVPTADERVLPGGTAYITDLGMTGPLDGVIGMDREAVLRHQLTRMPHRYEVAPAGRVRMDMALVEVEESTGRAQAIHRLARLVDLAGAGASEPPEADDDRDA